MNIPICRVIPKCLQQSQHLFTGRHKGSVPDTWCSALVWGSSPLLTQQRLLQPPPKQQVEKAMQHRRDPDSKSLALQPHSQKVPEAKGDDISEFYLLLS